MNEIRGLPYAEYYLTQALRHGDIIDRPLGLLYMNPAIPEAPAVLFFLHSEPLPPPEEFKTLLDQMYPNGGQKINHLAVTPVSDVFLKHILNECLLH